VVDVRDGRLLALYSRPGIDPNELERGVSPERLRALLADPARPLTNRALNEVYAPGGALAPFVAWSALHRGVARPETAVTCRGGLELGRRTFRDTRAHGPVTLHDALARSCSVWFYDQARALRLDDLAVDLRLWGFGVQTRVAGLGATAAGVVPTRGMYESAAGRGGMRAGYVLHALVGQGDVRVTPLQLAMAYAALGNGGTLLVPRVVDRVLGPDLALRRELGSPPPAHIALAPAERTALMDALRAAVADPSGAAHDVVDPAHPFAGHRGVGLTAASRSRVPGRDVGWFAALAPADAPRVAVVVETEGTAPGAAGLLAADIVRAWSALPAREVRP
jgi:penicillin-binding protein 2